MTTEKTDNHRQAAERSEREQMFGFHPEILAEAGELPRKSSGQNYVEPDSDGERTRRAATP